MLQGRQPMAGLAAHRDGTLAVVEEATGAVLCESAALRRSGAPVPALALCGGGEVAALAWPDRLAVFAVPWGIQAVEVLAVYNVEEVRLPQRTCRLQSGGLKCSTLRLLSLTAFS